MPGYLIGSVLFAAFLHAVWNAIVKSGADKQLTTIMITTSAGAIAALLLPFLPQPAAASWPFIAASALAQFAYYGLLAAAYRRGDLSHTYPIMRGTAPLIVAALSGVLIGEAMTASRWLGVGLICGGVLGMAMHRQPRSHGERSATAFALGNALVIASYTLIDGLGVRKSHSPPAYALWIFLLTAIGLLLPVSLRRRADRCACMRAYMRGRWSLGLVGGAGPVVSVGIALWAMRVATVARVAALRETSILCATVISRVVLKERVTPQRRLSTALIAAGAVALRLA